MRNRDRSPVSGNHITSFDREASAREGNLWTTTPPVDNLWTAGLERAVLSVSGGRMAPAEPSARLHGTAGGSKPAASTPALRNRRTDPISGTSTRNGCVNPPPGEDVVSASLAATGDARPGSEETTKARCETC